MLWVGGFTFETPPPLVTNEGIKPFPATGVRKLHSRTSFLYAATGVSPAMCMRLTGIGSQYLMAVRDVDGNPLEGGKTYRVTLPPNIPAARFWSFTVYDNETRSMLQTPQRFPRAGSQSFPTPAAIANADGSTTITFGPDKPDDAPEGNWIQTAEGQGWFPILRLYSPLESVLQQVVAGGRDRARALTVDRGPFTNRRTNARQDRRDPSGRPRAARAARSPGGSRLMLEREDVATT